MEIGINQLEPFDDKKRHWHVVIETPKGGQNKYKYDQDRGAIFLSTVLPEGMAFPFDFGFLPMTVGGDGDPLDVLLLMGEPAFPGCIIPARLIGVFQAQQSKNGRAARDNHRIVAVPLKCREFHDCKSLKELNSDRLHEIEQFFVSYNRTRHKCFRVTHIGGPKKAEQIARAGMKDWRGQ